MSSYTNFMMGIICHIIKKAPCCFSERMKQASAAYFYNRNEIKNNKFTQDHEKISSHSLLFPRYNWTVTGVQHLQPLSLQDAIKAKRWHERNSTWRRKSADINPTISRESWLDRLFFIDIFENAKVPEHLLIRTNTQFVTHCYLSVLELKGGHYFLSTSWYFTDAVTQLLQHVPVDDMPLSSINYETCNPFKHNFSAAILPGRLNKSDDRLIANIDKIHKEIKRLGRIVQNRLGISELQEGIYTLNVYNDDDCSYFDSKHSDEFRGDFRIDHHAIHTSMSSSSIIMGDKAGKEFLISSDLLKRSNIPYLAIYSVPKAHKMKNKVNTPRDKEYFSVEDSINIFQLPLLLNKKFDAIVKSYRRIIILSYRSPAKYYYDLYDASLGLMEIINQANVLRSDKTLYMHKIRDASASRMQEIISMQLDKFNALYEDVIAKKEICIEKVSANNLIYQRKMTHLVVLLAVLQVVIAIISLKDPNIKTIIKSIWQGVTS
ncbi:TPA: hypothetical protein ACHR3F_003894 [Yersinia enterocolitica]